MHRPKQPLSRRSLLKLSTSLTIAGVGSCLLPQSFALASTGDVHEIDLTTGAYAGAPDGREREIFGYNDMFPGPEIRAKEGDLLRIKVSNNLDVPTSIHWHGMKQRGSWTMDGVTPVSRDPIKAGESFVYEFIADPAGTHWYHSHTGVQYSEGLYGPLIIESRDDPYTYDRDQVLMIGDWFLDTGDAIFENIKSGKYMAEEATSADGADKPDLGDIPFESFIFNGQGQLPNGAKGELNTFPLKKGETVRFRIINTSSTYTFKLQFGDHAFTVIETDGQPVAPVEADGLIVDIGERFDILLTADQSGTQYIRAATMDEQYGLALLQYEDEAVAPPPKEQMKWGPRLLSAADLVAPQPVDLSAKDYREVVLEFSGSMMPYAWPINGKQYPDSDPVKVSKGETIRFVMKNPTKMSHPFHIHGHYFHVLGRPDALNLINPPLKDTVSVPAMDELVIQFDADNPGNWFFHCHIEWHLGIGMGLVIEYQDS